MPVQPAALSDADLLARLVAFDSTSRNSNLPIADFLCDYLDRPGVRVLRNPSPGGDKVNLIFMLGPAGKPAAGPAATGPAAARGGHDARDADDAGKRRPGLVLSGHMDVVPAEEKEWESDPFTLTDRGDRYVGRGACDMKGFLALAANLALEAAGRTLAHPLALVFTYDEEVGTLGARRLVDSCPQARALPSSVVIGEPTGLRVVHAHKGHMTMRVTLHGRSAHSGYPHLGINAVEPAGEVIVALARLRRELEAAGAPHAELFPEVPFVPLNVGRVQGGAAINVVPDGCTVELGLRALPGIDSRQLAARVEQAARAAAAPFIPDFEVLADSPPLLVAEDAPVLRRLCSLVGQRESATVSFATDAGWLQRLGMDCVLFGPGSIDAAHRPNEFVPKADLTAARDVLERAIAASCQSPPG
ncbi:MAG TPA: acetylornithine deacetylase [Thermoanaerobaculia bacterium]|nr:acetylornithine deacetylase [Thermoanaerobaculia bacterium]